MEDGGGGGLFGNRASKNLGNIREVFASGGYCGEGRMLWVQEGELCVILSQLEVINVVVSFWMIL